VWALELLRILVKKRRFIIVNTLVVTLLAVIVSLILPRTYRAKATILPPESESPLAGLAGLSAGHIAMAVTNFALPLMATPSDLYASMLESETILKAIVDSLDLKSVYRSKTGWDAVSELKKNIKVRVEPDGIISVEVDTKDRQLSANIANLLVATLDRFNRRVQNQKGKEFSGFLVRRLAETDSSLSRAQTTLRKFQESHRAISLDLQSQAMIKNLAEQKALLTSAEIEMELLKKTLYPDHPELRRKQMEVREYRNKLKSIEDGALNQADSTLSALDIPLSRIPDLTLQFAIFTRNAKIQELTYELLSQQLEMARLQEHRDTPTIMVLDVARPPELPVKPQKKMIVIAAFMLSGIFSCVIVVGRNKFEEKKGENDETLLQLRQIAKEFKSKPWG
jgi:tyrosine-protein kinase Etk/Wzc